MGLEIGSTHRAVSPLSRAIRMGSGVHTLDSGSQLHSYNEILAKSPLLVVNGDTLYNYCGATIRAGAMIGNLTDICADTFASEFE